MYDHKTAGKTTWRLAKEVTKLGEEFDNLMKERAKEQNANEAVSPEGATWEFANVFTEISENKKDQLTTSAVDLGDFIKNVKEKGRKAANAFRNETFEISKPQSKSMQKVQPP